MESDCLWKSMKSGYAQGKGMKCRASLSTLSASNVTRVDTLPQVVSTSLMRSQRHQERGKPTRSKKCREFMKGKDYIASSAEVGHFVRNCPMGPWVTLISPLYIMKVRFLERITMVC